MKRGYWLIFFVLIIFLSVIVIFNKDAILKITGLVPSQEFNVSIEVLASPATLTLINPVNGTYSYNWILLNFSVSNQQAVWFNTDGGTNKTITGFTYFNVSLGSHVLYIFANNSEGSVVKDSKTFYHSPGFFNVTYNEYQGPYSGNSFNFSHYSYEEMQNLSNVILEHTQFGKLFFTQLINLTDDSNPGDGHIDLASYTNISSNRIEINTSALPNLNKSAILTLTGLTFTSPRILFDGSVCPSAICTQNSYSGGNLSFNVTHFTVYSTEETPAGSSGGTSGGGGGGGGSSKATVKEDFSLNKEKITVSLKQGETKREELIITNNVNKKLEIELDISKIEDFIKLSEESFYLNAGESKKIDIDFIAREDAVPDLYVGKIIIKGDNTEKEVLVVLEIESEGALFDVKIMIPQQFLTVFPGEDIVVNIKLFEVGDIGRRVDVEVGYNIVDSVGNFISIDEETIAVEGQTNYIKVFRIPEEIKEGDYNFYVKTNYEGKSASASRSFIVSRKEAKKIDFIRIIPLLYLVIIVVIILIIIYVIFRLYKVRKERSLWHLKSKIRDRNHSQFKIGQLR